jgi:hypothetical protein
MHPISTLSDHQHIVNVGRYTGTWSAYQLTLTDGVYEWTVEMPIGIRGSMECVVVVDADRTLSAYDARYAPAATAQDTLSTLWNAAGRR